MEAAGDVRGKEEERGQIPSFKSINFTDLDSEIQCARDAGQYTYISDMTGKA